MAKNDPVVEEDIVDEEEEVPVEAAPVTYSVIIYTSDREEAPLVYDDDPETMLEFANYSDASDAVLDNNEGYGFKIVTSDGDVAYAASTS